MLNLLKAELYKLRKDKSLLIGICIVAGMTLFSVLLMGILSTVSELSGYLTVESQIASSFSVGNNVGIVIPIICIIFVGCEFSFGTIRNKIAKGYSRTQIYLSNLFSVFVITIILQATTVLLTCLAFFFFETGPDFNAVVLFKMLTIGFIMVLTSSSISCLLVILFQKRTMAIVITLVVSVFGVFAVQIISYYVKSDVILKLLEFVYISQSNILLGTISWGTFFRAIGGDLVMMAAITFLGIVLFRKSELK